MDYQLWGVLVLITGACCYLAFMGVRGWRRIREGECSTSCGCPSKPKTEPTGLIEADALTARLRRKPTV